MKKIDQKRALAELQRLYPDAKPALHYTTAYELLIAVILSAQCTDERVNKVTEVLFQEHATPETMLKLTQSQLERYIFSCGFYRMKAEHILSATKDIMEKFHGEVPNTIEDLMSLAGVGKKTANVVYSVAFGGAAIAVDTHVFRVANRLGIGSEKSVIECEKALKKCFPKSSWGKVHLQMVHFGRYHCKAKNPSCNACKFQKICLYYNKKKD